MVIDFLMIVTMRYPVEYPSKLQACFGVWFFQIQPESPVGHDIVPVCPDHDGICYVLDGLSVAMAALE